MHTDWMILPRPKAQTLEYHGCLTSNLLVSCGKQWLFVLRMKKFVYICEQVSATAKKLEKTAIVAGYFGSSSIEEAAASAIFLSGRAFPLWEETTLQVGGSLLWRVVGELSGKTQRELTDSYKRHGDLGSVA